MANLRNIIIGFAAIAGLSASLTACVSMPDFDQASDIPPEFQTEIDSLDGYAALGDSPAMPTDMRSAAQWDARAARLLARSNAFDSVSAAPSARDMSVAYAQLMTLLHEYRLDDPQ